MATDPMTPTTGRTRLATTGARRATEAALMGGGGGDRLTGIIFQALLLLGLSVALFMLAALLIWSLVEGAPRLGLELLTNGPSTVRPEQAGFRTAILGSLLVVGGVVAVIVPVGV